MKKINNIISNKMINILTIFLLLQPIIDLITGIQTKYYDSFISIGVILRFIFMLFIIYYILFVSTSNYKKYSIYYFIFLGIYTLIFLISSLYVKDISLIPEEIKWLIKNYYFPILLVGFINFYDSSKERIEPKTYIRIIASYILIIILCKALGIENNAYTQGKTGYIGLFYSANEISGIISLLLPFIFFYKADKSKLILKVFLLILTLYCTLTIGSKTAFLSFIIIAFIFLIDYIIKLIKLKKYMYLKGLSLAIVLTATVIFIFLPYTAFYKNIKKHVTFLNINNIGEIFEGNNINRLIFSDRLTFIERTEELYEKANTAQKIIGIGYSFKPERKTIEMDYFDIYYCYGPVGFIVYFTPFGVSMFIIFRKVKSKRKALPYVVSISLALLLALFTGHIFTAPSVSIYISLIIAYVLTLKPIKKDYGMISE